MSGEANQSRRSFLPPQILLVGRLLSTAFLSQYTIIAVKAANLKKRFAVFYALFGKLSVAFAVSLW
jgi:hypothetical protein